MTFIYANNNVINKTNIGKRFGKNASSYTKNAEIQNVVSNQLLEKIKKLGLNNFSTVVEAGCGPGNLTQLVLDNFNISNYIANDLVPEFENHILNLKERYSKTNIKFICKDAELLPYPNEIDLFISGSTIQWFNNSELFFDKLHQKLNSDGILAISSFGRQNFKEIKQLTGCGLNYTNNRKMIDNISYKYELLYFNESVIKQYFKSALCVLKHIKQTGVNGNCTSVWTPRRLQKFCSNYELHYTENNRVYLSWHPQVFLLRKREY